MTSPLSIRPLSLRDLSAFVEILADLERDVIDAHRTLMNSPLYADDAEQAYYAEAVALRDTLQGLLQGRMGRVHSC